VTILRRHRAASLVFLIACGPKLERIQHDANDETAPSTSGHASTSSSSSSTSSSGDATTSTEESSSTGPTLEEICATADPKACPPECTVIEVYNRSELGECSFISQYACAASDHAAAAGVARTFYSHGSFVIDGDICGMERIPDGWAECFVDRVNDPPECACFCRDGVCPGDADRLALEACGVDQICAYAGNDEWPQYDRDDALCVLAALRDRTPGMVEANYSTGFTSEHTRAYLDGTNEVTIVQELVEDFGGCPAGSWWNDAQRCTLTAPAVFDACMAGDDWAIGDCLKASTNWFESCRPAEPSCP
jgi:hypothetical protein